MERSLRLTDILLEPVSNLMRLFAEGAKLDAAARRREAQALLSNTRRLPTTGANVGQINATLVGASRGSVAFAVPASGNHHQRGVRPIEGFSVLAYTA